MTEQIAEYFVELFNGKLPEEVIVFLLSMLPVLELRGGMIAAKLLGLDLVKAFVICFAGNILPVPFILLFIRYIFAFLKKFKVFEKIIDGIERRTRAKGDKVKKYQEWGLLAFVAIPLPGTGAWTGALLADLFDLCIKKAFSIICLGVLVAGIIMAAFSYGLLGLIFN